MRRTPLAVLSAALLAAACAPTSPAAPDPPRRTLTPEVAGRAAFVNAFANLRFERPVFLTSPPGAPGRVVVLEQAGRVLSFPNRPDVTRDEVAVALDLPARRSGNEEGLLGLAFHPDYAVNRQVFVHYSMGRSATDPKGRRQRGLISRFTAHGDGVRIDPQSEQILLEIDQPYKNHNGGMLAFGEDGYLYIGLGDGGAAGDPKDHGQNLGTMLGSILRIDVDRREAGKPYAVPPDNPFLRTPGARPEIYAYGLRNPWRFSFDRRSAGGTGALWVGDVGQNKFEEIAVVAKGENHGWRIREGFTPYKKRQAPDPPAALIDPVVDHLRKEAGSITGGYVYRGAGVPSLRGAYIYGDYVTSKLFMLRYDGGQVTDRAVIGRVDNPASFGIDGHGELYVCSFDDRIYRMALPR